MGNFHPITSALRSGVAVAFTAVCFFLVASCDQGPPDDIVVGEDCGNNIDNDGDGWFGCDDPDCVSFGGCNPADDDTADDDTADDDDTTPAGDDDTATPDNIEGNAPGECSDGEGDEDGDGYWDCYDSDCAGSPACSPGWDQDGDGYCEGVDGGCYDGSNAGDCNDLAASVHPGAPDVWGDGVDNDCDGVLPGEDAGDDDTTADDDDTTADDDDTTPAPPADSDGDGDPDSTDCNDSNAQVNHSHAEVAGNGIDDDCDGSIDEGTTPAGNQQFCWEPSAAGPTGLSVSGLLSAGVGVVVGGADPTSPNFTAAASSVCFAVTAGSGFVIGLQGWAQTDGDAAWDNWSVRYNPNTGSGCVVLGRWTRNSATITPATYDWGAGCTGEYIIP